MLPLAKLSVWTVNILAVYQIIYNIESSQVWKRYQIVDKQKVCLISYGTALMSFLCPSFHAPMPISLASLSAMTADTRQWWLFQVRQDACRWGHWICCLLRSGFRLPRTLQGYSHQLCSRALLLWAPQDDKSLACGHVLECEAANPEQLPAFCQQGGDGLPGMQQPLPYPRKR